MKRFIIAIVIIALLAGGYYWLKQYGQLKMSFFSGKTVLVTRGDLDVPITASGRIEPASITKIKGKASGTVTTLPFDIGKAVRKGEVIVALDQSDEQRNVDRANADYERAMIALERAKITRDEAEKVGIPAADADLAQAKARFDYVTVEWEHKASYQDDPRSQNRQEWEAVEAQHKEAAAAVAAAEAKVTQAATAVKYADMDIKTMEQSVEVARKAKEDAEQRLEETTVVSPIDGMVLRRQVEIGEVVQSGKTSLTGGTVLIELADVSSVYAVVNVDEADIGLVRDLAPQEARPGYATMPADTASRPEGEESGEVAVSQPVELPEGVIALNQSVELEIESFPSESFSGVIERIAPQSDISQAIATFKVWIRVTGDNRSKLVGLLNVQAEAHFKAKSVSDAILVSYDAFQKNPDGDGFGVYVPAVDPRTGKKNRKEFRPCVFGRDNGINVEVIEGLKEGEEVWTKLPINRDKDEAESSR